MLLYYIATALLSTETSKTVTKKIKDEKMCTISADTDGMGSEVNVFYK